MKKAKNLVKWYIKVRFIYDFLITGTKYFILIKFVVDYIMLMKKGSILLMFLRRKE
jgi:hypothetical protein